MLKKENSLLMVIDVQEKLVKALSPNSARMSAEKTKKIIQAAKILDIAAIITEQYPKGLGATIKPVRNTLGNKYIPFEKTYFSAIKEDEIYRAVLKTEKKQVVILGIEAHICVFQTAVELFEKGYEVFAVSDISFSRKEIEKDAALQNLRQLGIQTPTLEMILFMWLEGSKNKNFKEIQGLIK